MSDKKEEINAKNDDINCIGYNKSNCVKIWMFVLFWMGLIIGFLLGTQYEGSNSNNNWNSIDILDPNSNMESSKTINKNSIDCSKINESNDQKSGFNWTKFIMIYVWCCICFLIFVIQIQRLNKNNNNDDDIIKYKEN